MMVESNFSEEVRTKPNNKRKQLGGSIFKEINIFDRYKDEAKYVPVCGPDTDSAFGTPFSPS